MSVDAGAPVCNPGFLDTMTWDEPRAARLGRQAIGDERFAAMAAAVTAGYPESGRGFDRLIRAASGAPLTLVPPSACAHPRYGLFLVGILSDGQHLFVTVAAGKSAAPRGFGKPLCERDVAAAGRSGVVRLFPVDLLRLRAFLHEIAPAYASAIPDRPGLGIGCRMGV